MTPTRQSARLAASSPLTPHQTTANARQQASRAASKAASSNAKSKLRSALIKPCSNSSN